MAGSKGPARSTAREAFWRRIVAGQPASGRSIRDWCLRHEVSEPSFYAWRREIARREAPARSGDGAARPPKFVEVHVTGETVEAITPSAIQAALTLVVGGARIEVAAGFDAETLARLLDVLREADGC
jgi:hypothetical protein